MATSRKERKARFNLRHELFACPTQERPEAAVEPKLFAMVADEVEDRTDGLANAASQAAPKLLQE